MKTTIVPAKVEWFNSLFAVVSFVHPTLKEVEREFTRSSLPNGADQGDGFDLEIELDDNDRVCAYRPLRDRPLRKKASDERDLIPCPEPPIDCFNDEEMEKYGRAMLEYHRLTQK